MWWACVVAAAGFAAASAVAAGALPQQGGTVDLLTQANVMVSGATTVDRTGRSVAAAGDVNGDGRDDVLIGAPGVGTGCPDVRGASYVVYGSSSPVDVDLANLGAAGFRVAGAAAGDCSGYAVGAAGDVNGDGRDDIAIGAPYASPSSRTQAGSTYVIFGSPSPSDVDLANLSGRGFRIDGVAPYDRSGWAVAGAGDVNGDGRDDVLVGAPLTDQGGINDGSGYVVFGSETPANVDLGALGTRGVRIDGNASTDNLGRAVAGAGDLNGDGRDDVIIGSRDTRGSAYVVFGSVSIGQAVDLSNLGSSGIRVDGADVWDDPSVSAAGDVNGDGRDDVIIGSSNASPYSRAGAGSSYVVYGSAVPDNVDLANLHDRGFRIDGAAAGDHSGFSVAGAGDVNGDGRDDVIIGAPYANSNAGMTYVVYGSSAPSGVDLGALGSGGISMAASAVDRGGYSVAGVADINGDGRDDVLVGAPFDAARGYAGAAYVVYGFGQSLVAYPGAITGGVGTSITPMLPTVARTGTASFAVSPALPDGLALDAATGAISGTPTVAASSSHMVTMNDLTGAATDVVTVSITGPPNGGTGSPHAPSAATSTGAAATASPATPSTARDAAPVRLASRSSCAGARCTTTGTVPAGATRVVQSASRRGARATARDQVRARMARGQCTIGATGAGKSARRTFSCRISLAPGQWTVTTEARAGATVLARSSKIVRVGARGQERDRS